MMSHNDQEYKIIGENHETHLCFLTSNNSHGRIIHVTFLRTITDEPSNETRSSKWLII
jgi:hypothetical protein